MKQVIQFLKNVKNAQRNAWAVDAQHGIADDLRETIKSLRAELAALRQQVNKRGAGGRFVPKSDPS